MKIAVIGASNNKEKYGYKIVKDLSDKLHDIFPVNPKENTIYNLDCYNSISKINKDLDIVCFIIPPKVTLSVLQENESILKNLKIWIQPGAEDDLVEKYLKENFCNYVTNSCLMLQ